MEEIGGVASAISPLAGDADQELQRLENLTRDAIEPRIVGLRMRAVGVAGGFVIVIRVPRSWNLPHRVTARNTNRIYLRNSAGAYEASLDELRALFTLGATAQEHVRAFRAERLAKIDAGEAIVPLASQHPDRLVLHLVPLSAYSAHLQIDLERAYQLQAQFRPLASMGFNPTFNFDGFANTRGGDQCMGYTQVFRNGALEAVRVGVLAKDEGSLILPSLRFDKEVLEVLPLYLGGMQSLEVSPPLVLMLSLQGVRGAVLWLKQEQMIMYPPTPIDRSTLELPEIVIDAYGSPDDYERTVASRVRCSLECRRLCRLSAL